MVDADPARYTSIAVNGAAFVGFMGYCAYLLFDIRSRRKADWSPMKSKHHHYLAFLCGFLAFSSFFNVFSNAALLEGQGFTIGSLVGEVSNGSVREWGRWVGYTLSFSSLFCAVAIYLCIPDAYTLLTTLGVTLAGVAATFATLTETDARYYVWTVAAGVMLLFIVVSHFAYMRRKDSYAYGLLAWILLEAVAFALFWILGQAGDRQIDDIGIDSWIFTSLEAGFVIMGVYMVWTYWNAHLKGIISSSEIGKEM